MELLDYGGAGLWSCWIIEVLDYGGVGLSRCWIMEVLDYRRAGFRGAELKRCWIIEVLNHEGVGLQRCVIIEAPLFPQCWGNGWGKHTDLIILPELVVLLDPASRFPLLIRQSQLQLEVGKLTLK